MLSLSQIARIKSINPYLYEILVKLQDAINQQEALAGAGNLVNPEVADAITFDETAAPATPASGKGVLWFDSTDHRLHEKNSSGVVATTVGPLAAVANKWVTGLSSAGVLSVAQPASSDLSDSSSLVRTTRQINTTAPLGGGGALSSDLTLVISKATAAALGVVQGDGATVSINGSGILTVVDNTSTQKVEIAKAGTLIGTRHKINLIEGSNVTLTVADDSPNDKVDVTIASPVGSGFFGYPTTVDSSKVQKCSNASPTFNVDTSQGGVLWNYTVSGGDHVGGYFIPVTPSNTLKVRLNFTAKGVTQCGPAVWNANNGNILFIRLIPGNSWHISKYAVTTGLVSDVVLGSVSFVKPYPSANTTNNILEGFMAFMFDGTNVYLQRYLDPGLTVPDATYVTVALATWPGTNYTHVGVGTNGGSNQTVWLQDLHQVSA